MSVQAIFTRRFTMSATFAGKPSDDTRKDLLDAGFQYDSRSGQWYRSQQESEVVPQEVVAKLAAA